MDIINAQLPGPVNALLSWKGFIVLGRLTYGVYLVHFGLGQLLINQVQHTYYLNPTYEVVSFINCSSVA